MNSTLSVTAITYYRVLQKLSIAAEKHNPKAPHAASTTFFPTISDYRTTTRRSFSFPAWAMDAARIPQDSLFNMRGAYLGHYRGPGAPSFAHLRRVGGKPPAPPFVPRTWSLEPGQRKA